MITVAKMGGGKERYYTGLAKEDYYAGGELSALESEGVWIGRGAERLGIEGMKVEREMFKNLFRGFSPDGTEKWVHNAGRFEKGERDRMPGFDLTFGLPKSVSIAYAIGSRETREAIERAARGAMTKNLGEIEKGCVVRSGKGGKIREEAGIIAGVFQHATARQVDKETPPDPHIHYHVTVINTGLTATGKTGALQGRDFLNKTFAKEWGAKFREDFERGLQRAGFETVKTKDGFELKGISKETIEHFSKRTAKIEQLAPKETHSYREQKRINVKSRVAKGEYEATVLERYWKKEAFQFGLTPTIVDGLRKSREGKQAERKEPAHILDIATRRDASKSEKKSEPLARGILEHPDDWKSDPIATQPEVKPTEQQKTKSIEKQAAERKAQKLDALREMKREYEREGLRVIGCTFKKVDAEEMTMAGFKSYTVARLWGDVRKETELEKMIKKSQGIKTREDRAKEKFRRTIYAEFKYATGQWDAKTRDKYKGDYYKPSSKAYHEFLYATYQISAKQRDFMNGELERNQRRIDQKTVVLIYGDDRTRENATVKNLVREVEKRGGTAVVVSGQELRMKAIDSQRERAQQQQTTQSARAQSM